MIWMRIRILTLTSLGLAAALLAGTSGCRVHVDKSANGRDKNVQVDTLFGGVNVNTDQTTATDLGLPAYPGAQIVRDKDNDKSADVHMGFGDWELRVKAVNYSTADSQDKVEDFYRKALTRYGDVILCDDRKPVGSATSTSDGLTCDDRGRKGAHIEVGESKSDSSGRQLKAGSERHQHIVGFEKPLDGQTRFSLVAIDLPIDAKGGSGNKD